MNHKIWGIGISANTPFSFAIIDELGCELQEQKFTNEQLFYCFDYCATKQVLNQLGFSMPSQVIDLKVEICLLSNEIERNTTTSCFHQSLHEMVLNHQIDTVAPDGDMWLHPSQKVPKYKQSNEFALRHAKWLQLFWQKYQSKINIEQAIKRGDYCRHVYEVSTLGFPVDLSEINNSLPVDASHYALEIQKMMTNDRCYSPVKPYGTRTGRNSTSSSHYPLSIKGSLRYWFKPLVTRCFVHLDFHRQEIGIAAALSQDKNLKDLYQDGDPYQWFANQCNPPIELKKAKIAFIAFQYGALPSPAFSKKISLPLKEIKQLYKIHHATFTQFWNWTERVIEDAQADGFIALSDGWRVKVTDKSPPLSIINWPIQATGAQLLRDVVCRLGEQCNYPIGLNHDAVLFECTDTDANELAAKTKKMMQDASQQLLGFELAVSVDIGQSSQSLLQVMEK